MEIKPVPDDDATAATHDALAEIGKLAAAVKPSVALRASTAQLELAHAHDAVLQELDKVEAICRAIRSAIEDRRQATDQQIRAYLTLCDESRAGVLVLEDVVKRMGGFIVEGTRRELIARGNGS